MIRNIIFDLGGVLIDWNPKYLYRTIFDTEKEMDWFLENITVMDWNLHQDAGRDLDEATQVLLKEHPKWADQIKAYYGRWEEMLGGPINGTVEILEKFVNDNNYRVLALTNWSHQTFPIAQERYEFLKWFEGIVVSGEEKCRKPHHEIYHIIIDRYKLIPEECLFIDDNVHNVEAAIVCGMKSVLFESPEKLKGDLTRLDVLN